MFGAQKPRLEKLRILRAHIFWAAIYKKKTHTNAFSCCICGGAHTHTQSDRHAYNCTHEICEHKEEFFLSCITRALDTYISI